jgi:aspartyl-tRNA(Asn)/glutamyl-tRNA(Gln) amidotransferase subunit A
VSGASGARWDGAETSSLALVEAALAQIAAHDGEVHALMTVLADRARETAAARDRDREAGRPLGLLHGMPVVLKDNIDTAGVRTTSGSLHFADNVPATDAEAVRRLDAAGAVLLGKASMAEFAMGAGIPQNPHYPEARNPWDLDRIPGGSSSGSAAAVAADMTVGALGTDTGGSVRIPAAFCGVVGMRPTRGRVSNRGTMPVSPHFDTVGQLAHRAADVAHLLAAVEGYDDLDPTSDRQAGDDILAELPRGVDGLRIGVPREAFFPGLHPEVERALLAAIAELESAGATVRDVAVSGADVMPRMTQYIRNPDAIVVHEERLERAPELFGGYVRERLRSGMSMTAVDYARARAWQADWVRQFERILEDVDLLATPMVGQPAPRADDPELGPRMSALTGPANAWVLAGLPAASVPCGFADGVPVAIQLVGPAWHDGRVLRAAHAYQQRTDWHLRRPALIG